MNNQINLKKCPWATKRVSVSYSEMQMLIDYLTSIKEEFESILEFGCGSSSWYLSQLNPKKYVAVEELDFVIEQTKKHVSNIEIVTKWEDIPSHKYQCIFIDSHVGGGANGNERHKTLINVMQKNIFAKDAILVAHDVWGDQINTDPNTINVPKNWKETLCKYGWKTIKSIKYGRCFGVYKMN